MTRFVFQGTGHTTGGGGGGVLAAGAVAAVLIFGGGAAAITTAVTELLIVVAVVFAVLIVAAAALAVWWLRKGLPAREARAAEVYAARFRASELARQRQREDRELAADARQARMVAAVVPAVMSALNPPQPQPVRVVRAEVER